MKNLTNRKVRGARYRQLSQIANACPLVSVQWIQCSSSRYLISSRALISSAARTASMPNVSPCSLTTFSARPSLPAARNASFFNHDGNAADAVAVATDAALEASAVMADAKVVRSASEKV